MKRTTISLPDDLAAAVEREARRLRVPVSQLAREGFELRLGRSPGGKRPLAIVGLGHSGFRTTARDAEEILAREWGARRR